MGAELRGVWGEYASGWDRIRLGGWERRGAEETLGGRAKRGRESVVGWRGNLAAFTAPGGDGGGGGVHPWGWVARPRGGSESRGLKLGNRRTDGVMSGKWRRRG